MNRIETQPDDNRADRVLAKVRHKQLETALRGRIRDSARYAQLASRVRRALGDCGAIQYAA